MLRSISRVRKFVAASTAQSMDALDPRFYDELSRTSIVSMLSYRGPLSWTASCMRWLSKLWLSKHNYRRVVDRGVDFALTDSVYLATVGWPPSYGACMGSSA